MSEGIGGFVKLEPGVAKWLYITDPRKYDKVLLDPQDQRKKNVTARRWTVLREDGVPVNKVYDVTSVKHDADLMQLFNLGVTEQKEIGITMLGSGFTREYKIETRPVQS
jgi:hypothetical protein